MAGTADQVSEGQERRRQERGSGPVTGGSGSRPAEPDGKAGIGTNNSFSAASPQPRGGLLWQASVPCPAFPCPTTLAIGGAAVNSNPQAEVIKIFEFATAPESR